MNTVRRSLGATLSSFKPRPLRRRGKSKVIVVDDDTSVRDALCELLRANRYEVESFSDGTTFLRFYRHSRNECVLIDLLGPEINTLDVIAQLRARGEDVPTIVLSRNAGVSIALQEMKGAGAYFVQKPACCIDLLSAIRRALKQASTVAQPLSSTVSKDARLTAREREILDGIIAGRPNKNIAADLGISQRTVEAHRAAIMNKTGSKSLANLIRTAICASCPKGTGEQGQRLTRRRKPMRRFLASAQLSIKPNRT